MSKLVDLLSMPGLRSATKAIWTPPLPAERDAPERRIIHIRILRPPSPVKLGRIGFRVGEGYFKCGSHRERDEVRAARLLVWRDFEWRVLREFTDLSEAGDQTMWHDLGGEMVSAAIVELRRCEVDGWWTGWNLANSAVVLEGEMPGIPTPQMRLLEVAECTLENLPAGITAQRLPGEVRFTTPKLSVGFRLRAAAMSWLSLGPRPINLLRVPSAARTLWEKSEMQHYVSQGPRLHPIGGESLISFERSVAIGETRVRGNTVSYELDFPQVGLHYSLCWEVLEDRLRLHVTRSGEKEVWAWESGAWQFAFNSAASAAVVYGSVLQAFEVGLMNPATALIHFPGHGKLAVSSDEPSTWLRVESNRPMLTVSAEIKIGEVPGRQGGYMLLNRERSATIDLAVVAHEVSLAGDAPAVVREAVNRELLSAIPYRPDTDSLSNNGNSMHAPICADHWQTASKAAGKILPELSAMDLLGRTIDRWLNGAPGYASGRTSMGPYLLEDEYLQTPVAMLSAIAEYLEHSEDSAWLIRRRKAIDGEIDRMRRRDVDGDGLVESNIRLGISGGGQWSTNWWDVIGFGWKDAFVNAILYGALVKLAKTLESPALAEWAALLNKNYEPAFMNSVTGWLAGWRCKGDKLHDYGFLFVNGAAVCNGVIAGATAERAIRLLWDELQLLRLDYGLGLPGNIRPVDRADLPHPQNLLPADVYEDGSLTHSQSRHFVGALYRVGMEKEGDQLLEPLCATIADGTAFGGCDSGLDWRRRDGTPAGYEGILCDQFGILSVAVERYSRRSAKL